jgi:DNA-binding transcriptional LysR family regulator
VKRVERILGVTLFARNTRRVEITAAGREFVAVAERMLNDLQLTVRNMGEVTREQRGRITISTYSAIAVNPLPHMIRKYRQTRPLIEVRVKEGRQSDIVEDVRGGAADFGIGYVNNVPDLLETVPLGKEPVYVIVPTTHPLAAKKRPRIRLADLRDETLISGPSDSYLRRLTDGAAAAAGFQLHYHVTVDRLLTVVHHVCAGVGIGILPKHCLPPFQWGEGYHAAMLIEPSLSVSIGLLMLRGRYLTPAASGLVTLIREQGIARVGA